MAGESARAAAHTRRDKAERLLRSAEAFDRGAEGEESTAQFLAALPMGEWRVFHDVRWPGRRQANLDHVVVGPSGVFVIDSKAWSGSVEVRGGVLRQDGHRRSRPVIAAAAGAMAVSELLPGVSIKAVKPVLCFVRDEPVFGWAGDVMVCSTHNLVTFLTSSPRLLDEAQMVDVAGALATTLEVAAPVVRSRAHAGVAPRPAVPAPAVPARRPRFERPRLSAPARRLVRWGLVALLIALAFRLDVPARLGDLAAEATQRVIAPTKPIGTAVPVPAMGSRPSLEVTAGVPVITRSTRSSLRPRQGQQLVAVPLRIENTGDTVWTSDSDVRTGVTDEAGNDYSSDPAFTDVAVGPTLPETMKLRAGKTRAGFVVFEVPRGTQIAHVRVSVGPGLPKSIGWSVG